MADSADTEEFKLDLDSADFVAKALEAREAIDSIGEVEGIAQLTSKILEVGAVVGVLGTALYALKTGIETVFDAEQIKSVNAQFETFAKTAGVVGEDLKKGLLDAAQGWASEGEVLQAANKALVEMQVGAEKLPQIMELARQATAVFGGSLIENFNGITQAIASGNTKQLKHLGIVIDQQKAYRDFATSIGATVDELTLAGKQQAVLEAALAKGKDTFSNVNTGIREATNAWAAFKSTLKDIGEMATLVWDKLFGDKVRSGLNFLKDWAQGAKTWFTANFGEGADQAAAKTSLLKDKVKDLQVQIIDLEQAQKNAPEWKQGMYAEQIDEAKKALQGYEAQLGDATEAQKKFEEAKETRAPAAESSGSQAQLVDHQKQLANQAAFNQKMLQLKQQYLTEELRTETDADDAEEEYREQMAIQAKQIDAQIAQVRAEAASGNKITQKQAAQEIMQLEEIKKQKLIADETQIAQVRQQALDNYAQQSKTVFEGVARGAEAESNRTKTQLLQFGQLGTSVTQAFGSHMATAFQQMGSGAKSGTDAMKSALFGMIGDVAAQYGQMMMLASLFPPDPALFAAGAALEVLAGALGNAAGGGSQYTSSDASMTGSGVSGLPSTSAGGTPAAQGPKNAVTIQIQGHMFQTQETQNWLVNTIRAASDATDFTIASVK